MTTREMILRAVRIAAERNDQPPDRIPPERVVEEFDRLAAAESARVLGRLSGRVLDAVTDTVASVDALELALTKFAEADDVGREFAAKDARDAAIAVKVDAEFLAHTLQKGRRW